MNIRFDRRYFVRSALAAPLAAALPFGKLLASTDGGANDVEAVTGDGRQIILKATDVKDFGAQLRGELLLGTSPGYDAARKVWNGAFDKHPALIARCSGAADVSAAVKFAAAHGLLVAVRGGGHSLSGQSVCEKGLMIDLAQMDSARVDAARRRAYIEGGALLGALDHEALSVGLATTAGTVSHTGVGGLTLGGGFGRLGRRFGLACDNVRSIDLVTPDGRYLTASDQENKDLFWGLRGGGGNFGVATSFEFQLHPVDPIMLGGELVFAFEDAAAIFDYYFDYAPHAPDELNLDCALVRLPNGARFVSMEMCYSGPRAPGEKILAQLRAIRKPIQDDVKLMPYVDIQASGDVASEHGHKYYIKGGFVQKSNAALRDAVIGVMSDSSLPTVQAISLVHGLGAYARVKTTATAFAQRAAECNMFAFNRWDDPAMSQPVAEWTRATWAKLEPFTRGFYVNEYGADDAARISTTYGVNYDRMVALKTKYDPQNLFRMNANVPPKQA